MARGWYFVRKCLAGFAPEAYTVGMMGSKGKNLNRIATTALLFILLAAGSVLAQPASIIGDWVQDNPQVTWSFRGDGSGIMERGQPATTARFNWTVEGNILKLSTATGAPVVYQIVPGAPNELVIVNRRLALEYHLRRK